ncbi:MAG: hypothetical protein II997_03275 [Clostridia bacterium]|nr:hypothetical protein [Clostridia bacterium]
MQLRDKFWLWGHPEGRYNAEFGNDKPSRMTPMEGCLYLGVRNVFMVPVNWEVNERQYNKSFKTLNQVGWGYKFHEKDSCHFDRVLEQAKDFPNITCVAFDDFKGFNYYADDALDQLKAEQDRLHNNNIRRLDSWMILYTNEFGIKPEVDEVFQPFMDQMDGIIMWTWEEKDVPLIPEKFELFKKMTPHNRRMVGVYLYNFGEHKQATGTAVTWQLNWAREKLLAGEIEGIVLHTNTMADLDFEAYDAAVSWMEAHGDEEI